MRIKPFFYVYILLGVLFLFGCSDSQTGLEKTPPGEVTTEKIKTKNVKAIAINEANENSSTPSQAILSQFEVMFEDGKSEFPEEKSVITETILGNQGILTINSPEGEDRYAIFLYSRDQAWKLDGMIRIDSSSQFTDKKGLYLPMENFNSINTLLEKTETNPKRELWAFVDKTNIITISRFDRFSFDTNLETTKISNLSNGNVAYISQNSLYYFDSGKIVILTGNVTKEELIELANSLPSVLNINFPATSN